MGCLSNRTDTEHFWGVLSSRCFEARYDCHDSSTLRRIHTISACSILGDLWAKAGQPLESVSSTARECTSVKVKLQNGTWKRSYMGWIDLSLVLEQCLTQKPGRWCGKGVFPLSHFLSGDPWVRSSYSSRMQSRPPLCINILVQFPGFICLFYRYLYRYFLFWHRFWALHAAGVQLTCWLTLQVTNEEQKGVSSWRRLFNAQFTV